MTTSQHPPRIAVVGAGLIGQKHINLVHKHAALAAVVDPSPATQDIAAQFDAPWFPDLDSCLHTTRPDGVIVATPNHLHAEQAITCIGHGLPVLVEKPIADTAAAAQTIVTASQDHDVPVLVGHHRRHNPLIKAAKSAIDAGELGKVVAVNAQFLLYKPDDYFNQSWRRKDGAGPVFINLIHDLDLLRHLCGDITAVQAMESHATRDFQVEDTAVAILSFENGALGTVSISDTAVAPWSWEFTAGENPAYPHMETSCYQISGTHGALSLPDLRLWTHQGKRGWWEPMTARALPYQPQDPLVLQLAHFADVIAGKAAPLVSAIEGLRTLQAVEAIKQAASNNADLLEPRFIVK